jgi:hypothetical protein
VVPGEDWARIFETNVMSGVRLSCAYMPRICALCAVEIKTLHPDIVDGDQSKYALHGRGVA